MRLLETPYYTLDMDPSVPLVIFRRRDVPYPSCSAIEGEAKRIEQAYITGGHKSFHLLVDLRPSLPRNDPDFEKAIVTFRRQLVRYAFKLLPGPDESFLQQVFSQGVVTSSEPPHKAINPVTVATIKAFIGLNVSVAGPLDQQQIIVRFVDWSCFIPRHNCRHCSHARLDAGKSLMV